MLIAMLLCRAAAGTEPMSPQAVRLNAAVIGQVINGLTGKPVPDARVAAGTSPEGNDGVTSDAQGRFVLRDLPQGPFIVSATNDYWAGPLTGRGSYGQQTWSSPPRTLQVTDGQIVRGIVVPFWPDGVITGRITDAAGEPMAGAVVGEMKLSLSMGRRERRDSDGRTASDDRGVYRLSHAPGSFFLAVASTELRARSIDGDASRLQAFAFPDTYFPGVTKLADARLILLQPGQERSNVDFQLTAVPAVRVRGVVMTNGAPASGISVQLESIGPGDGSPVPEPADSVTDSLGRFSFQAVLPGDYRLSAHSGNGCRDEDGQEALPARLSVSTEEVAGLWVTLSPCPLLTGEVRFPGGLQLTKPDIDGVWINRARDGHLTAGGRFNVRLPPGRQELEIATPNQWTVRSITVDGRDATDRPVDLSPGATHHVVVVLSDAPASVSCDVAPAPGAPSQNTEVYLFPVDESARRDFPRPERRVREELVSDGSVCFDDVPPGEYFVVAVYGLDDGDWPAAGTMDRIQSRARRIVVGEGQDQKLSLQAIDVSTLPKSRTAFMDERRLEGATLPLVSYGHSPALQSTQLQAPHDAVLRGRVLIAGSDAPLAGATVTLERQETPAPKVTVWHPGPHEWHAMPAEVDPVPRLTMISDESGRFAFTDVPAGVYSLVTERLPFAPGAFGSGRFPGPATPIVVRAGDRLEDLEIRMGAGASIGGFVTDVSGAALGRASVSLFRITWTVRGPTVRGGPSGSTEADDLGRYRFWGLPAGEYALEARASAARDYFPVTKAADLEDPLKGAGALPSWNPPYRVTDYRYGAGYYPASVSLSGDPTFGVILVTGEDRTVDLRMAPGAPPTEGKPPGARQPYPDVAGRAVFAPGSTPPSDLSGISMVMKPLEAPEVPYAWRGAALDASGRFRINRSFGERFQWGVIGPPPAEEGAGRAEHGGWIVTSVMVNGREALDSGTDTAGDGGLEDVVVTLSDRPASVEGTVAVSTGAGSGALDGTYVVLYPADAAARLPQSPRVRAVKPDSDRHFKFEGLVPGVYLVATVTDVPEGAWWDPAVLDRLAASAVRVGAGPGSRVVLQVR
jgi:hypothetical protein